MSVSSVRRVPRFLALALPTAIALALAACSDPVGPREPQARKSDRSALTERAVTLSDSSTVTDSTGRSGYPPWW